ncbi:Growth hormone secretagogue receptor type 1 [Trichoplax sp. H2]|nr:Growth hormone secretagogue receptor type 1 [Trichoplax sp. H2]|eukprot:RDD36428.1 Growth hormone secretagogue receptor type 1 [Trichoplax sp. H2]
MDANRTINQSIKTTYYAALINTSVGVVAFILNLSVCFIIITHSTLRQPFNHLILNLSFSDLLVSLAVFFNGILDYFSVQRFMSYELATVICKINMSCTVISLPGACLTLLEMSIERYHAVAIIQFRSVKLSTVRKAILIIWILAIFSAIIPIIYTQLDPVYPNDCFVGDINNFALLVVSIIVLFIACVVSIAIMLIFYSITIHKLCHNMAVVQPLQTRITSKREQNTRRTIIPILFLSIFSSISSVPYVLLNYYIIFNQYYTPKFRNSFIQQNHSTWAASSILFILTTIINPLLYNLASSKFREVIHGLICCRNSFANKRAKQLRPVRVIACNSSVTDIQSCTAKFKK